MKSISTLDVLGRPADRRELRAGLIGCGSHAFRNVVPTFQFAGVRLVATCDRDGDRAAAFAERFGGGASYRDHQAMVAEQDLEAAFIVAGSGEAGRPLYPALARDCLDAGLHVWIEKPSAAPTGEIDSLRSAAARAGRTILVGFKKMFAPANTKTKALMDAEDFGLPCLVRHEYPQRLPTVDEMQRFLERREPDPGAVGFLDHLCHPVSVLVYILGMPDSMLYERTARGAGVALFGYPARHVVVENNTRVEYHRLPFPGYGDVPDFYGAAPDEATVVWQPEFSLGQLYNKGLFLLGYYAEVDEFVRSIHEERPPRAGTLDQAWQVTRVFEAFARPPGTTIDLTLGAS